MISKTNTTKNFGRTIGYLMNKKERYDVLIAHGVSEEKKPMIRHFELQATLNKRCKVPALHMVLSHHPDDSRKIKGQEKEIVEAWIEELKVKKNIDLYSTQFAVVTHKDRDHQHYHFVINLVTNSGRRLNIDYVGLKAKDVSKTITKRYGLTPAVKPEYRKAVIENDYQIKKGINQVVSKYQEAIDDRKRGDVFEVDKLLGHKRGRVRGINL